MLAFVSNPFAGVLFLLVTAVVAIGHRKGELFQFWLPFIVSVTAMVHLTDLARSGVDFDLLLNGHSLARYGVTEGRNLVNVTGSNLSIVVAASYIYARNPEMPFKGRWVVVLSAALLLIPIAATGSRSSWILLISSILTFEVVYSVFVTRSFRSAAVVAATLSVFVVVILSAPEGSFVSYLGIYVGQRFELLSSDHESVRWDAVEAALSSPNFFLGALQNAQDVIGGAQDVTFSNYILSYGFVGLVLVTLVHLIALAKIVIESRLPIAALFVLAAPLAIRSLSEGSYLQPSIMYCYLLFTVSVAHAFGSLPSRSLDNSMSPGVGPNLTVRG